MNSWWMEIQHAGHPESDGVEDSLVRDSPHPSLRYFRHKDRSSRNACLTYKHAFCFWDLPFPTRERCALLELIIRSSFKDI